MIRFKIIFIEIIQRNQSFWFCVSEVTRQKMAGRKKRTLVSSSMSELNKSDKTIKSGSVEKASQRIREKKEQMLCIKNKISKTIKIILDDVHSEQNKQSDGENFSEGSSVVNADETAKNKNNEQDENVDEISSENFNDLPSDDTAVDRKNENENIEDLPLNDSDTEETDEDNANLNKKIRGKGHIWIYEAVFGTQEEIDLFVETEYCWKFLKNVSTKKDGVKKMYRCKKRENQCEAQIYTIQDEEGHKLFRKNAEHTHENVEVKSTKVSEKIKQEIIRLRALKYFPKTILYMLLQNPEMQPVPTQNQINYIIKKCDKEKNGNPTITLLELRDFLESMSQIPDDEDESFVLRYELPDLENEDEDNNWFRFILTTKRLIEFAAKTIFFHADGTYKITYHGFPILVIGTSDKQNHFHLIGKQSIVKIV